MNRETKERYIEWAALVACVLIGPVSLVVGYELMLIGDLGVFFLAACCAFAIPFLMLLAGRLKYFAWQAGVLSIVLSIIVDNVRLHAIYPLEALRVAYVFWASGTMLSSPVPIYFILKPMPVRDRVVACVLIVIFFVSAIISFQKLGRF
jgi:hypothetical protein